MLLSSHILSEVQAVCERVLVLSEGVVVADDKPEQLSRSLSGAGQVIARIAGPSEEVSQVLQGLPSIGSVQDLGSIEVGSHDWALGAQDGTDLRRELFFALAEKSWPLLGLRSNEMSLEDVFLRLTKSEAVSTGGDDSDSES